MESLRKMTVKDLYEATEASIDGVKCSDVVFLAFVQDAVYGKALDHYEFKREPYTNNIIINTVVF